MLRQHLISRIDATLATRGRLKVGLLLVVLGINAPDAIAQVEMRVVTANSLVAIEGKSNVTRFICQADDVDGFGILSDDDVAAQPEGEVVIPVRAFDCRNGRMNRDLFDALRGEQHPFISYRLENVRVVDQNPKHGAVVLEAHGTIWVAGVGRHIRTRVVGDRLANGYVRATGTVDLSMSDFDIDPPTAVLGLVRVHDEITVRFNLTAELYDSSATGSVHLDQVSSILPVGLP